jgi:hypothetical protein
VEFGEQSRAKGADAPGCDQQQEMRQDRRIISNFLSLQDYFIEGCTPSALLGWQV